MKILNAAFAMLLGLSVAAPSRADFMDIVILAPGGIGVGSFSGTLDGIGVTGALTAGALTVFNADPGPFIGGSTVGDTSPQHSFGPPFFPTKPLSDKVGFSAGTGPVLGHVTVLFASPITNPVIHVANLDVSFIDFATTAGIGPLVLLSGNGALGDGLAVGGTTIFDLTPATIDLTPHTAPPPMGGPRSAYGSVLIVGTYAALDFDIITPVGIENASFTFSTVPEPSSILLGLGVGLSALGVYWHRRRKLKLLSE